MQLWDLSGWAWSWVWTRGFWVSLGCGPNGMGTPLVVQWLGLCPSTAGNVGSIPGWRTEIAESPGNLPQPLLTKRFVFTLMIAFDSQDCHPWEPQLPMRTQGPERLPDLPEVTQQVGRGDGEEASSTQGPNPGLYPGPWWLAGWGWGWGNRFYFSNFSSP